MTQVLIVGAGPAGIRAAEVLVAGGVRPIVVDEGARSGGQIYRRPPEGFTRPAADLYGSEAAKAQALHQVFGDLVDAGRIIYHPASSVTALVDGMAQVVGHDEAHWIAYDRLIVATGATDRLAPVPGWQVGGVFGLGAAQIALKSQAAAIGRQIVLAGSGPLLTLVAHQLRKAGAGVEAVLDTAPFSDQIAGGLRMAAARPIVTARGAVLRAGMRKTYHTGVKLDRIEADDSGPVAIHWHDARGRARETPCDAVALGWHLRSETHLADLAGARFEWSDTWEQWLPCADDVGRAGNGLYLAGDGLRVLGADGAEIAGRVAGAACLADMGLPVPDLRGDLRRLRVMRRFARGIARAFPWPAAMVRALPDAAVLCRCEGVTAGQVRATTTSVGADANRVKSLSRVGMGRCQGRYCQLAKAEVMAQIVGVSASGIGRLRAQPPVRPVSIAALCGPDNDGDAPQSSP